jgi:hypothetical protein
MDLDYSNILKRLVHGKLFDCYPMSECHEVKSIYSVVVGRQICQVHSICFLPPR